MYMYVNMYKFHTRHIQLPHFFSFNGTQPIKIILLISLKIHSSFIRIIFSIQPSSQE